MPGSEPNPEKSGRDGKKAGKKTASRVVPPPKGPVIICPNCKKPWDGPPPSQGDLLFCKSCDAAIPTVKPRPEPPAAPEKQPASTDKPAAAQEQPGPGKSIGSSAGVWVKDGSPTTLICTGCGTRTEAAGFKPGDVRFCDKCNSSLAVEKKTVLGKVIGKYAIESEIGRGGMAVVYKATQQGLNRQVAVKVLLATGDIDADRITALHSEAQSTAKLRHPNIVTVLDVGEAKGLHYIAMDLVEGKPLSDLLGKRRFKGKAVAVMMAKLARAVHYAHDQGVIHRDIKPSNILLEKGDEPKLMDFGLARSSVPAKGASESGGVSGTPSYMPPEQARNEKSEDRRSDVYSLGAVLYALLAGVAPFNKPTPRETLDAVINETPRPPREINSSVPPELDAVCMKAMSRDRDSRYPSAKAFAEELEHFINDEPVQAMPGGKVTAWIKRVRRNPIPLAAAAAGVLLLAVVVVVVLAGGSRSGGAKKDDQGKKDAEIKQQDDERRKKDEASRRWEEDYRRNKSTVLSRIELVKEKVRNLIDKSRSQSAQDPDLALRTLEEAEIMLRDVADRALESAPKEHYDRLVDDKEIREAVISRHDLGAIEVARAAARGARGWKIWNDTLDLDAARGEYNIAIQVAPDDPGLLMGRGIVLSEAGMWREAFIDFKRLMDKNPQMFSAVENLKCFLEAAARAGASDEIDSNITKLPDQGPDRPYFRGLALFASGDLVKAAEEIAVARKTNFMDPRPHIAMAEILLAQGNLDECLSMLNVFVNTSRSVLSSSQAAKDPRKTMLDQRHLLEGLLLRARVRIEIGRKKGGEEEFNLQQEAKADLEEASKINPSESRVKKVLQQLGG